MRSKLEHVVYLGTFVNDLSFMLPVAELKTLSMEFEMKFQKTTIRVLANTILVVFLLFPGITNAADWSEIKPQVTTEREMIDLFGSPTEITADFSWKEWNGAWEKRPEAIHYIFRYRKQESKSQLLIGPGGPADYVEVDIFSDKVFSVKWFYGGPSARSAKEMLESDQGLTKGPQQSEYSVGKHMPHGYLFGIVTSNASKVILRYELK